MFCLNINHGRETNFVSDKINRETLNVNRKAVLIPQSSIAALEIISQALLRHNTPPKRSKHSQLTVPEAARVKVAPS